MARSAISRAEADLIRGAHWSAPSPEDIVDTDYQPISPSEERAVQLAISLLWGKWRIAILMQLQNGPVRLGELRRRLSPVSKKVLNQHLRQMENDGLVSRSDLSGHVPHVEYSLAKPLGFAALTLMESIARWGAENAPQLRATRNYSATLGLRLRAQERPAATEVGNDLSIRLSRCLGNGLVRIG